MNDGSMYLFLNINAKHQHDMLRNTELPGFSVMVGEAAGTVFMLL